MSTFYEAYAGYNAHGFQGELGNILFTSPWANPADSRLKPAAFQGAYLNYTSPSLWTVEAADMMAFENRTSSAFSQQTLLTSFPAGNNGMAFQHLRQQRRARYHHRRLYDGQGGLWKSHWPGILGRRILLRRVRHRQHVVVRRQISR